MTVETNIPNLFLAGAARSGTTSLAKHLSHHSDIFMPSVKEPHFLASFENDRYGTANQRVKSKAEYTALYDKGSDVPYLLDASTSALYFSEDFIRNLNSFSNRQSRCLLMLRNPAKRALSHYKLLKGRGIEKRDMRTAILSPDTSRYAMRWGFDYLGVSRYMKGLEKMHLHFGLSNVMTLVTEELADSDALNRRLADFLEIDKSSFPVVIERENDSALWNGHPVLRWVKPSRTLRKSLRSVIPSPLYKPAKAFRAPQSKGMDSQEEAVIQELQDIFYEDVVQLEQLLNRDLSAWKNS